MTDPSTPVAEAVGEVFVYLGNRAAIELINGPDGPNGEPAQQTRRPIPGAPRKNCTTVVLPQGTKLSEAFANIAGPRGLWQAHSDADAPAWVASTWPQLSTLLAAEWGCEIRDPEPDHVPSGDGDAAPVPAPEV